MNKCPKCDMNIHTDNLECPLCGTELSNFHSNNIFPNIKSKYKNHQLLIKLSFFISLLGAIICLLINYTLTSELTWSIFVILGITSFWLTFIIGIKKRKKFMTLLLFEILSLIALSILWDLNTGFHKWSIVYVFPFLCISYTITFLILRIFTNKIDKDIIIYSYLNSLIGLTPLYFILTHKFKTLWPSITSVSLSILALIFLFIFNHRTLESEIERRLHI